MATQGRELQFYHSLSAWGHVFMRTVWLQSIMTSAIAMKDAEGTRVGTIVNPDPEYFRMRNRLMKESMQNIWSEFKCKFCNSVITTDEELTAITIMHLLAPRWPGGRPRLTEDAGSAHQRHRAHWRT